MKFSSNISVYLLVAFSLLVSCKKNEVTDPTAAPTNPTEFVVLQSTQWKVMGKQSIDILEGVLGGGMGTVAFSPQKSDELRWYTLHRTMSNVSGHNEMVINKQGQVVIQKELKSPSFGGVIKAFAGNDVWKLNMAEVPNRIYVFKNDQQIDLSKDLEGQNQFIRIQASEDGILNSSEASGSNYVSHYLYATQKWKSNRFAGNNFVCFRYKGLTYVISFTRLMNENGMRIEEETSNRVEVQDPQIPSIKTVHYPMKTLTYIPGVYGTVMHASIYGDNVFVAFFNHTANNKFGVCKVNLTNLTVELVQVPEMRTGFGLNQAGILYNASLYELDDAGNLYIVESRSENNEAYHSIRKYGANGEVEVFLKEQDLALNSRIQGIKYFNGKLHVAVINKQDIPDGNPNDFSFKSMYYMQIIAPN